MRISGDEKRDRLQRLRPSRLDKASNTRAEAFEITRDPTDLPQSEATIGWLISEIERLGDPDDGAGRDYQHHLADALSSADISLLCPRETALRRLPAAARDHQETIARRMASAQMSTDQL